MEVTLRVINLGTWCDTHGDFLSLKLLTRCLRIKNQVSASMILCILSEAIV